jgi:ABC-type Fe3+/spermidine/putrescine transport system ATPase subunit
MDRPLIQVRNVSLQLGEFAVRDADLTVFEGEYFVLLGPTGAGKTVLLECIAGLHRPERGEIHVNGLRVDNVAPEARGLGYLPQDYALFPHLDVERNIGFGMRIRRRPAAETREKVRQLADLLGIAHLLRRKTLTLSGGERQRVALARALAIEPKVLLLDEPLSALDEQTREGLCVELRRVHEELGTTTVHVSHNFEETLAVADRIGIIHEGRIRQVGSSEDVFRRPTSEFVARFVRSENILRGVARTSADGATVEVGDLRFRVPRCPEGDVYLTVRPEEVALALPGGDDRQPNAAEGRIARVVDKGALIKVELATVGGVTLTSLVGRRAFHSLDFQVGDEVVTHFEPTAAHVFPVE